MTCMENRVAGLRWLAGELSEKLNELFDLGFSGLTFETQQIVILTGIMRSMEKNPDEVNLRWFDDVKFRTQKLAVRFVDLEERYYKSLAVAEALEERACRIEDGNLRLEARQAFAAWNAIRLNGANLGELKVAHSSFMGTLEDLEQKELEDRVNRILNAPPARKGGRVRKASERQLAVSQAGPAKGKNSAPPKDGGYGTSRKSLRQQRKHVANRRK